MSSMGNDGTCRAVSRPLLSQAPASAEPFVLSPLCSGVGLCSVLKACMWRALVPSSDFYLGSFL